MTTITELADEVGYDAATLATWMVADPTGTDYEAGPDPHGRTITTSSGTIADIELTAEGEETLRSQADAERQEPIDTHRVSLAHQLRRELHERAYPLAVLAGPDAVAELDVEYVAQRVAAQIAGALAADDDRLLAECVIDVMAALWPVADPPPEWWQTWVGRACAHSAGDDGRTVTQSVAAAMLGLAVGSIGPMIARGDLERGPEGGVTVASIMARITR